MRKFIVLLAWLFGGFMLPGNAISQSSRLVYDFTFAPGEGLVNKIEKEFRKEICLNGYWDFQPQAVPQGYTSGRGEAPQLNLPDDASWSRTRIKIPSPWNINAFANRDLDGPDHRNYPSYPPEWDDVKMAWMKKTVTIPTDWKGMSLKLHFEAVAGFTEVYVNKQKVVENFDIFLPFEADITDAAKPGETIEILVGVRDQALFENRSTIGRRVVPAGSMWGYHIRGIWQDVYLTALPRIHVEDVFVKPLVSEGALELEITVRNNSAKKEELQLHGVVNEWLNRAGTDVNSAPVPAWELGRKALDLPASKIALDAGATETVTMRIPVAEGALAFWTPEHPNLYALVLSVGNKKATVDKKYERFGWREWTIEGANYCLNGKPIELKGDSWHFMGVPQMTRRYAWAWFTAIKGMNGNAVRPHAQIYPRFYLDVADEMGVCVLNETANWASDGGPKLDSEKFWEASKEHLERFVLRDRNHASIFGWSVSNENKPVILHVFNRPDLMPLQKKAWEEWRDIVMKNDSTRPWISADGEDDGDGILPVTVGHYGGTEGIKRWADMGKPWGIGEHSMAYYGTPEQVSEYNGEEAYTSQYGRMVGLANQCYQLIVSQREKNASYVSVFNMAWYALKPLPLGKKDLTTPPSLTEDGIFFTGYMEGVPGIQPERMGPYSTTFNPGYDPSLPLYDPWPMYDAMRAANAPGKPAWSPYADVGKETSVSDIQPLKRYREVFWVGRDDSRPKQILDAQGVKFSSKMTAPQEAIYIIDGSAVPDDAQIKTIQQNIAKGADLWIWGIVPRTVGEYNRILPLPVVLEHREGSSFIPKQKSWMEGLKNSDFYFSEIQRSNASDFGLSGDFVREGEVLLNVCNTDWRKWNRRPEELKTASVLRSENEAKGAAPVFVRYQPGRSAYYVSTLTEFANSEKGFGTLSAILNNAGIPCGSGEIDPQEVFFIRDGQIQFPTAARSKFIEEGDGYALTIWVFSPRPLDDLLIEPDMPKLTLYVDSRQSELSVNGKPYEVVRKTNRNSTYDELPLLQGWNKLTLNIGKEDRGRFNASFRCGNNVEFLSKMKFSFIDLVIK